MGKISQFTNEVMYSNQFAQVSTLYYTQYFTIVNSFCIMYIIKVNLKD